MNFEKEDADRSLWKRVIHERVLVRILVQKKNVGHARDRTWVMGYHLSTRILFMRPCEVSKSPNTDTLLFPSKVILEPHLQILREYVRNRRNSPWCHEPNQLYYMTI